MRASDLVTQPVRAVRDTETIAAADPERPGKHDGDVRRYRGGVYDTEV